MQTILSDQIKTLASSSASVLSQLDADFDKVLVMINRRKQLVKHQVQAQYEDKLSKCTSPKTNWFGLKLWRWSSIYLSMSRNTLNVNSFRTTLMYLFKVLARSTKLQLHVHGNALPNVMCSLPRSFVIFRWNRGTNRSRDVEWNAHSMLT